MIYFQLIYGTVSFNFLINAEFQSLIIQAIAPQDAVSL